MTSSCKTLKAQSKDWVTFCEHWETSQHVTLSLFPLQWDMNCNTVYFCNIFQKIATHCFIMTYLHTSRTTKFDAKLSIILTKKLTFNFFLKLYKNSESHTQYQVQPWNSSIFLKSDSQFYSQSVTMTTENVYSSTVCPPPWLQNKSIAPQYVHQHDYKTVPQSVHHHTTEQVHSSTVCPPPRPQFYSLTTTMTTEQVNSSTVCPPP